MAPPPKSKSGLEKPESNAYRIAFEEGTRFSTAVETMQRCAELEQAIEALRVRYEQYFLGLTRLPPSEDHALVRSAVLRLRQSFVRNTSARFRVQSLHSRFLTYERLWQRTMREIEEGTYRRDLFKARLRRRDPQPADDRKAAAQIASLRDRLEAPPPEDDFDVDEDPEAMSASASVPASAPAPAPRAAPRRAAREPDGGGPLREEKLRAVYEAYLGAKRRLRENTDGITYEAVAGALRKQVPALLERHNARTVDFKVVIKGGKAVLKAVPR